MLASLQGAMAIKVHLRLAFVVLPSVCICIMCYLIPKPASSVPITRGMSIVNLTAGGNGLILLTTRKMGQLSWQRMQPRRQLQPQP